MRRAKFSANLQDFHCMNPCVSHPAVSILAAGLRNELSGVRQRLFALSVARRTDGRGIRAGHFRTVCIEAAPKGFRDAYSAPIMTSEARVWLITTPMRPIMAVAH